MVFLDGIVFKNGFIYIKFKCEVEVLKISLKRNGKGFIYMARCTAAV